MKQTLLAILAVFSLIFNLQAQSIGIEYIDTNLSGGVNTELAAHAHLKNISNVTIQLHAKRTDVSKTSGHLPYFCWSTACYSPSVMTSLAGDVITLAPGQVDSTFVGYLRPEGVAGTSTIQYDFYTDADATDSVSVLVKYTFGTAAAKPQLNDKSITIGSAYPNPAEQFINVDYQINDPSKQYRFALFNILGVKIQEKILDPSFSSLRINVAKLDRGIYFYTIAENGINKATKKIVLK